MSAVEDILCAVRFLANTHRCEIIHTQENGKSGDATVILKNEIVLIRISRDRRQYLIDFSPSYQRDEWFDFDVMYPLVLNKSAYSFHEWDLSRLDQVSEALENFYQDIETVFRPGDWEENKKRLKIFQDQRCRRMFPDLYQ